MSKIEFYTPKEVAEKLRVGDRTVLNLINRGQLEAHRVGKLWRIRESAIESYLNSTSSVTITGGNQDDET